jgi:Tfp pilus tip-associated adhesin PilY1
VGDANYGRLGANFNANGYVGSTNTGQIARNTESILQAKLLADDNVTLFVVGIGMKKDGGRTTPTVILPQDRPHLKVLRQVLRRMAQQQNINLTSAEYDNVASGTDDNTIGAGKAFFADDATELLTALQEAFDTIVIQAYSFTAPVVPAVRTTDSNRLYLSTFRPDNPPETFWEGACKSINLNADGSVPSDITAAMNWDAGERLTSTNRNYSTNPRKVYTASVSGSTWTRQDFGTSNTTFLDNNVLGVPSGERNTLIDETVKRSSRTKRLGDIYHSTPVVVGAPSLFFSAPGFSSAVGTVDSFRQAHARRQRVIYAGSNDGMLHGFNAGTWDTSVTPNRYNAGTGEELFAYIPKNLLSSLKNMKVTTTSTHQYMVDSSPKAADVWLDSDADNIIETPEWKTVIVTGERKGGRGLFALDITSPQYLGSSNYPVPLWEIDNAVLTNLGQTWSEPLIGRVKIQEGVTVKDRWVAFVGGGYWHSTTLSANAAAGAATIFIVDNTGFASSGTGTLSIGTESGINYGSTSATSISGISGITNPHTAGEVVTYSSIAKGFYVIDIKLGTVIWKLDVADNTTVRYPMTSSPAGVDSDNDGYLNYVYIVDLGGQLWRFDVGAPGTFVSNQVTAGWSGKRIFTAPTAIPQRAFNRVELGFDAGFNRWIFFGTGDREKPENPGTGRFYAIRDGDPSSPYTESNLSNFTSVIANTDNTVTGTVTPTQKGWFAVMPNTNEKILSDPVLFNDVLFFTTFKSETTNLCGGGGDARLYGIRASLASSLGTSDMSAGAGALLPTSGTARVRSRLLDSGGIPSSPVVSMSASGGASLYVGTTNAARVQSFSIEAPTTFKRLRSWKETIGQ